MGTLFVVNTIVLNLVLYPPTASISRYYLRALSLGINNRNECKSLVITPL